MINNLRNTSSETIIKNITSLDYVITPEVFLYHFRFHYWQNKLPYFLTDAYERSYHFGAISSEQFLSHVDLYNEWVRNYNKLVKLSEDPRHRIFQ